MIGEEASELRSMLDIKYPMDNGIVRDWEDMRLVWNYTFNEKLKIDPKESKVRICEKVVHNHLGRTDLDLRLFTLLNSIAQYKLF